MMLRLRSFAPSFAMLSIGAACLLVFQWLGSSIDAQGILREPFYLVGFGTACLILGTLLLTVASIRAFIPGISPLESGRS